MFSNLQDNSIIEYNNEIYKFIHIGKYSLGHFERGIKCKILCEYLNNEELKNFYMNKIIKFFNLSLPIYYNNFNEEDKEIFILYYNEIINDDKFNFIKENIKTYYFYIIIYLEECRKNK